MYKKGIKYDRTVPQNLLINGAFGSDCIGELIRLCAAQQTKRFTEQSNQTSTKLQTEKKKLKKLGELGGILKVQSDKKSSLDIFIT